MVALVLACAGSAFAHPAVTKPCKDCHEDAHKGEFGAGGGGDRDPHAAAVTPVRARG